MLKDRGENGRGGRGTSALQHARETFAQVTPDMRRSPAFAVFATQHEAQFMPLPEAAPELAAVGSHFYIKPILRMIDRRPHFYILAISAGKVRLYEADRYVWNDVTSRLPGGVQSVQAETDFEGGVQFSPVGRPNAGTTGGVVPGHSYESPAELHKVQVIEYLHRVASAVDEQLKNDPSPVVLAAEPEILGHFRKMNHPSKLVAASLNINPHALTGDELHRKALELLRPPIDAECAEVMDRINARLSAGLPTVAIQPAEIVAAAFAGRVEAVAVAEDAALWGHFDATTQAVTAHGKPNGSDEEMLNAIAVETLSRGGKAFTLPQDKMPRRALAAALLRW